ncbi:MAG: ATP-binding cassette domain-containing protein [Proteobacteria bacterium]|nr:ATP-binding cassette domain-containing protein [Pseudomonadota bacterium]
MLTVSRLERRFGGNRAVDGASFSVVEGSITGLIGPNGAGKTTAFNCISGFLRPDGGSIVFDGGEIAGMAPHRVFHRDFNFAVCFITHLGNLLLRILD